MDRGGPQQGRLMNQLCNQAGPIYLITNQDAGVNVLSASVGCILHLTTAHQNLMVKLRDAFTMGFDEVDIHSRSWPYTIIWSATYLIKVTLWD